MRRREFITLLGGTMAAWPLGAVAQKNNVPRIGILLVGTSELMGPYREALRDLGYVDGKNIQIEVHSVQGQINRLDALAAELASSLDRRRLDVA